MNMWSIIVIIDCIADLHGHYPELEGGDLLIVAGDLTARDTLDELYKFDDWLGEQNYKEKVIIAGNHDNILRDFSNLGFVLGRNAFLNAEYLCDSGTEFEGLKIWGSPWTKTFEGMNPKCKAFTVDTEKELEEKWKLIPNDIDILVTHSPPYGMKDGRDTEQRLGSISLLQRHVRTPFFESLKLHVFGHIHEGYGKYDIRNLQKQLGDPVGCVYVNASHVNEHYQPVNKPIRVVL